MLATKGLNLTLNTQLKMHEKILNFIDTISISPNSGCTNTVEITRDLDEKRVVKNSGRVKVKVPTADVSFMFDNDNGELLFIANYQQ